MIATHRIERWWPENAIRFLCHLKAAIEGVSCGGTPERDLLYVAFCRTVIELSAAAFNHQSMSFQDTKQSCLALGKELPTAFQDNLAFVLNGAQENPVGDAEVHLEDARCLDALAGDFDLVITSPPYANRMSYIRELRPYMYWLGFLKSGREAGELDWQAIGGTWGVATSRLTDWQAHIDAFKTPDFQVTLRKIAHADNKNGKLLSNYVAKYIEDMWRHFSAIRSKLAPNAALHYIVGNSTFYGVLLSVEQLYVEMLRTLGFADVNVRPIRKRNSKKELVEFDVSARWPA